MSEEEVAKKLAELQQVVEETASVANENNRLLRDMRRMGRISFWVKAILWIIVLGLPFFFIGPLFQAAFPAIGKGASFLGIPTPDQLEQAFQQLKEQSFEMYKL